VNSNILDPEKDMGNDGDDAGLNSNVARDAFGFTLNYFSGDYNAIDLNKWNTAGTRFEAYTSGSDLFAARNDLYNGNISAMVTTITNPDTREILPLGTAYTYDQLNRIAQMKGFANLDFATNIWKTETLDGNMYFNNYSYDANGNLLHLQRKNQAGVLFDSFTYNYHKENGKTVRNRLYHVNDSENSGIMADDIDDQGIFDDTPLTINSVNNYGYDEIGNLKFDQAEGIDSIEWTLNGKVRRMIRQVNYSKVVDGQTVYPSNLEFLYDAMGTRIAKIEKPRDVNGEMSPAEWKTTYYIRDAQGNPMATYTLSSESQQTSFKLIERPVYGSARLGIDNYTIELVSSTFPTNNITSNPLGLKQYELTNHLGNVLTTISDNKIQTDANIDYTTDYYTADITSASDYYPFGSHLDGRSFEGEGYRFGFNGKEMDNEVDLVSGSKLDFGARIYDSRLGRWLSVDPLLSSYPQYSQYNFVLNDPINSIDINGEWVQKKVIRYYSNGDEYVEKRWYNMFKKTTKKEVFLTVHNAKLYYHSGLMPNGRKPTIEQLEIIASDTQKELESSFNGSTALYNGVLTIIHYKFSKNIEVVDNLKKVKMAGRRSDDLIILVNNPGDYTDDFCGGVSSPGGNLMIFSLDMTDEWGRTNGTNNKFFVATHEGAHQRTSIGNDGHGAKGWFSYPWEKPKGLGTEEQIYKMGKRGGRNTGAGVISNIYLKILNEARRRKD